MDWYALSALLAPRPERRNHYPYLLLSITTNWLGYILLGGIIFSSGMVKVPERWYISQSSLQILGVVLLLISAFYLWACAFAKKRHLTIKASGWCCRLALRDIADGGFQPELDGDGAIIWLLLGPQVDYFLVLGVLLVSSIAGLSCIFRQALACLRRYLSPCFPGRDFARRDYCRPACLSRPVLLPAAAAGDHRLPDSGEPGEASAGENQRKLAGE